LLGSIYAGGAGKAARRGGRVTDRGRKEGKRGLVKTSEIEPRILKTSLSSRGED